MGAYLFSYTLKDLMTVSLGDVRRYHREGYVSAELLKEYCHIWQSSIARMALQVCFCAWCRSVGPYNQWRDAEYTIDPSREPSELGGES